MMKALLSLTIALVLSVTDSMAMQNTDLNYGSAVDTLSSTFKHLQARSRKEIQVKSSATKTTGFTSRADALLDLTTIALNPTSKQKMEHLRALVQTSPAHVKNEIRGLMSGVHVAKCGTRWNDCTDADIVLGAGVGTSATCPTGWGVSPVYIVDDGITWNAHNITGSNHATITVWRWKCECPDSMITNSAGTTSCDYTASSSNDDAGDAGMVYTDVTSFYRFKATVEEVNDSTLTAANKLATYQKVEELFEAHQSHREVDSAEKMLMWSSETSEQTAESAQLGMSALYDSTSCNNHPCCSDDDQCANFTMPDSKAVLLTFSEMNGLIDEGMTNYMKKRIAVKCPAGTVTSSNSPAPPLGTSLWNLDLLYVQRWGNAAGVPGSNDPPGNFGIRESEKHLAQYPTLMWLYPFNQGVSTSLYTERARFRASFQILGIGNHEVKGKCLAQSFLSADSKDDTSGRGYTEGASKTWCGGSITWTEIDTIWREMLSTIRFKAMAGTTPSEGFLLKSGSDCFATDTTLSTGALLTGTAFGDNAGSTSSTSSYDKVFDGDLSTRFDLPSPGSDGTLGVAGIQLATASAVERIRIGQWGGVDRLEGSTIEASTDGSSYTILHTIPSGLSCSTGNDWTSTSDCTGGGWLNDVIITDTTEYSYLRIQMRNSHHAGYSSIKELEFYGPADKLTQHSCTNDANVDTMFNLIPTIQPSPGLPMLGLPVLPVSNDGNYYYIVNGKKEYCLTKDTTNDWLKLYPYDKGWAKNILNDADRATTTYSGWSLQGTYGGHNLCTRFKFVSTSDTYHTPPYYLKDSDGKCYKKSANGLQAYTCSTTDTAMQFTTKSLEFDCPPTRVSPVHGSGYTEGNRFTVNSSPSLATTAASTVSSRGGGEKVWNCYACGNICNDESTCNSYTCTSLNECYLSTGTTGKCTKDT